MNHKIAKSINGQIYYGWVIILIAAISVFFSSPGQTYSISSFIDSYITDFNCSRTLVSSIYSVATILSGLLLIFIGRTVDKHGERKMLVIIGMALAIACLFNSIITNIFMMLIGFFLLRFLGQGSLTLIPGSLVPQWFEKKRALAISLYTCGLIAANMVVPAFNIWLINTFTWQVAWRFWALILITIFLPLAYLFVINKPEDIGLLPDNRKVESQEEIIEAFNRIETESWSLNEAIKTKEFWFIGFISMVPSMIVTGLMFHYFSIMASKGVSDVAASYVIGLFALPGFLMPIVAGLVIDRTKSKHILTFILVLMTCCMISIIFVKSIFTASIFMLILGFISHLEMIASSVIWVRYFGRKNLGSIRGAATVFMVVGSALGPIPFGLSFDLTQGYNSSFILMALITMSCLTMTISIKKPLKKMYVDDKCDSDYAMEETA